MHDKKNFVIVTLLIVSFVMAYVLPVNSQPIALPESNTGKSVLQMPAKPEFGLRKLSLLDPERFTMKHQYMMSFSSTGGNGSLMGMYLNTMEYRFNMPLIMRVKVAYQSQSAQLFGNSSGYSGQPNVDEGRVFIPSFDLVYQPFKNTTIGFFYRDYSNLNPYYYNSYNPYSPYSSYARNDWYRYMY